MTRSLEVTRLPFHIGSDPGCDLVVEDDGVSPRHAAVVLGEGAVPCLEARGLPEVRPLEPGTWLALGEVVLVFSPLGSPARERHEGRLLEVALGLLERTEGIEPGDHPARLQSLLDALVAGFGASWGALCEPGRTEVRLRSGRRAASTEERISRTALAALERAEGPVLLSEDEGDAALATAPSVPHQVRSVIAARLRLGDAVEGVVYLECLERRKRFSEDERAALGRICALAGARLAAARQAGELEAHNRSLRELHLRDVRRGFDPDRIVGGGPAMKSVRSQILQVATSGVTCLVLGESGTGKDLVARAVHATSARADGPFVAVNCATLSPELAESELFGHRKGAFTGAVRDRAGYLELAHGGVLFLDELADLPPATQPKLLRALEERSLRRLGEERLRPFDVQLVAATNMDLEQAVAEGRFRQDLYYRLAVFTLRLPPLRSRREDIPELLAGFLAAATRRHARPVEGFSEEALGVLREYRWPGNVRELANVVEQAVVRAEGTWIRPRDFTLADLSRAGEDPLPRTPEACEPLERVRDRFERAYIEAALEAHGERAAATYESLGMSRSTFYRTCKRLGIPTPTG